jgi:hemolysin activation/secretion protein
MRKLSLLLGVGLAIAVGCGGQGGGTGTVAQNPFAGQWAGTWSTPGNGESGTVANLAIGNNGNLTGQTTLTAQPDPINGTISGTVAANGQLSATMNYIVNNNPRTITVSGTVSRNQAGTQITGGNLTYVENGQNRAGTISLTRQ